jgi:hypothetical protein
MNPFKFGLLKHGAIAAALAAISAFTPAQADPNDYVFMPYGDEGARYVDFSAGSEKPRDEGGEQAYSLALGWSPTARWFTQVYAGWYKEPGAGLGYYATSWINHYQLAPAGKYPLDIGLYLAVERPRERDEGYEIQWGPTLQWDTATLQANLNIFFVKDVRVDQAAPTSLSYQWQVKGLWKKGIELGFQGYGSVGAWQNWLPGNQQEHRIGPAIFGHWSTGKGTGVRLDTAFLLGTTSASPRTTLRLRIQYEY